MLTIQRTAGYLSAAHESSGQPCIMRGPTNIKIRRQDEAYLTDYRIESRKLLWDVELSIKIAD